MSVIMESQEGDSIVIVKGFCGCEYGTQFYWEKARCFEVGEIVYFVDDYKNKNERQDYLAHKVIFKTEDGKIYSAVQICFMTLDEWNNVEEYFKKKFDVK